MDAEGGLKTARQNPDWLQGDSALKVEEKGVPSGTTQVNKLDFDSVLRKSFNTATGKMRVVYVQFS